MNFFESDDPDFWHCPLSQIKKFRVWGLAPWIETICRFSLVSVPPEKKMPPP